ncbi:MAG TPA: nuclear transport factor 2 family protein [Polyangia bacterium]
MRNFAVALAVMLVLPFAGSARVARAAEGGAEKGVLGALESWRRAMLEKDAAGLAQVFHADLRYGHSSGAIETKAQAIDHVIKSATVFKAVDLTNTKVSLHGETAFVTGQVHYEKHPKGLPILHQQLFVLSVWVKTPRGWQMIARQSTEPKPQPVAQAK